MAYNPEVGEDGQSNGSGQQLKSNIEGTIAAAGGSGATLGAGGSAGGSLFGLGAGAAGGAMFGLSPRDGNYGGLRAETSAGAAEQPPALAAPAANDTAKVAAPPPKHTAMATPRAGMGMSMGGPGFS